MGSASFDQPSTNPSKPTEPMAMVPSNHDHHGSTHCPRCDSTHTKFCYYNNYSLSQPRYFCKSCRRYWTKGGTLRNIPAGGLCRKIKKIPSNFKKPTTTTRRHQPHPNPHFMFENLATGSDSGGGGEQGRIYVEPRFTVGGKDNRIGGGFPAVVDSGGYGSGIGDADIHGLGLETKSFDDRGYLTLGSWEDGDSSSGCDSDLYGSGEGRNGSFGFLLGFGSSWAGLMNGYGSPTI